jgi:hypothetical protein
VRALASGPTALIKSPTRLPRAIHESCCVRISDGSPCILRASALRQTNRGYRLQCTFHRRKVVILLLSVAPFSATRNTVNLARCWQRNMGTGGAAGAGVLCRLYFIALFRHQFPKSLLVSFQPSPRSTLQPLNLSNSIHGVFMACSCKGEAQRCGPMLNLKVAFWNKVLPIRNAILI